MPIQTTAEIISNAHLKDDYYKLELKIADVCAMTSPGQFIHVQITDLRDRILRRPFSICNVTEDGVLTVIYKIIGAGTEVLSRQKTKTYLDVLGPLGKPFSLPAEDEVPVIVAGGYGAAATYLLAKRSGKKGVVLLGARTDSDLLLCEEYKALGYDLRISTNDGSEGHKGFVTELLDGVLNDYSGSKLHFYSCGPHPMLMALGKLLQSKKLDGELSLDHLMCCGVGACFACVVKIKDDNEDGWRYARTCKEGPVFMASEIYYA